MTLFPYNEVDDIGNIVDKALAPLVYSRALPNIDVVGSGFLLTIDKRFFFVTAFHTVEEYGKEALCLLINGKTLDLTDWDFYANQFNDICIAELIGYNLSFVENNYKIPVDRAFAKIGMPSSGALLIGFPKILNVQGIPNALPIVAELDRREDTVVDSDIPDPLIYDVSGEHLFDSKGNKVRNSIEFHGMSGGPIFGWTEIPVDDGCTKVYKRAFLQAVIVEWEPKQGYAVGVRVNDMLAIIDAMTN